jgi:hypothetical protein
MCIEYLMAQEHTHLRYNMVDSILLHILIKKTCTFILIIMMLMQKSRIRLLISNEQQHKGTFVRTQNVKILLERLRS